MSTSIRKIAILYSGLSGYAAACQRALKEHYGIELLVVHWPIAPEAPFDEELFDFIDYRYDKSKLTTQSLLDLVEDFHPDALFVSGWMDKSYLKVARKIKRKGIPVIAGADTQWKGNWRQRLGGILAPWYLHPAIDVLWVTGERQRQLAWQLGFRGKQCWTGVYACDWDTFAQKNGASSYPAFLFVGRLVERKGVDTLIEAYRNYRSKVNSPLELWVAGTGPLERLISEKSGIKHLGFVQPRELPELMQKVSFFVLPSRVEPWGVVLQEAAASKLPLICSDHCGAGVHLLREGYNGWVFQTGNVHHLEECLLQAHSLSAEKRACMAQASFELSRQYTPKLWSETLVSGIERLSNANGE